MQIINPAYIFGEGARDWARTATLIGTVMFLLAAFAASTVLGSFTVENRPIIIKAGYQRTGFGSFIKLIVGNPIMPIVTVFGVVYFAISVTNYFGENNYGVEFFVETEPEQAIVYVKARGNLSLNEKDSIVRDVEEIVLAHPGIDSVFAFAGAGGLNSNTSGAAPPEDTVGQIQLETIPWKDRADRLDLDGNIVNKLFNANYLTHLGFSFGSEVIERIAVYVLDMGIASVNSS